MRNLLIINNKKSRVAGIRKNHICVYYCMLLRDSSILTNIHVPGNTTIWNRWFEKSYITICSMDDRLYTDEELEHLPEIASNHPHYREWQMRKSSMTRLVRRLMAKKKPLDILEVGCGNGWLSHRLAEIPDTRVTALDINFTELQQAARVFYYCPNLTFIRGDVDSGLAGEMRFDIIVVAASIQYFRNLGRTVYGLMSYLLPDGEIHLLDSPLYKRAEIHREEMRTAAYYSSLGFPEMTDFHFHHCMDELRSFHHRLLHVPHTLANRLLGNNNPYPWICIRKNKY